VCSADGIDQADWTRYTETQIQVREHSRELGLDVLARMATSMSAEAGACRLPVGLLHQRRDTSRRPTIPDAPTQALANRLT